MARRLSGNTASLWESAWSGVIIRIKDDETVLAQTFRPSVEGTVYEKPVVAEIFYDESGSAGFMLDGNHYHLADFMRDNYMAQILEKHSK